MFLAIGHTIFDIIPETLTESVKYAASLIGEAIQTARAELAHATKTLSKTAWFLQRVQKPFNTFSPRLVVAPDHSAPLSPHREHIVRLRRPFLLTDRHQANLLF